MKKIKLITIILIIVGLLGYMYYNTSNETIEEVLAQDATTGSLSEPDYIIDSITVDNMIMCIYQTTDGRLGYSTINYKNRSYNKYTVCTNENIDEYLLNTDKPIVKNYDNMGLNYIYGIVVEPSSDIFEYNNQPYTLHMCDYNNMKIGYFLENITQESR
ncbi:hypothetical protein [Eubacterium sp.]|uniref:hypothetical protein n=1 Tax=Eubacterium sp. TaxID=142586 RepID=UPI0025EECF23|nr:hypothetical protein [uncultured Eubacterium sp.]